MQTARLTATGKYMHWQQKPQQGMTLIGLLFVVSGISIGMAATATLWSTAIQREKEQELLFIGDQYRQAIESFWYNPVGLQRMPASLDELLKDPRYPNTVRHLRRIYRDPITGNHEWGLLKDEEGGISGVYSLSTAIPIKRANFPQIYEEFKYATSYQQWVFNFSDNAANTSDVSIEEAEQE